MLNEKVKEEENEEKLTGTTGLLWCLLRAQLESTTYLFFILSSSRSNTQKCINIA